MDITPGAVVKRFVMKHKENRNFILDAHILFFFFFVLKSKISHTHSYKSTKVKVFEVKN